jgi:hypothetical protein
VHKPKNKKKDEQRRIICVYRREIQDTGKEIYLQMANGGVLKTRARRTLNVSVANCKERTERPKISFAIKEKKSLVCRHHHRTASSVKIRTVFGCHTTSLEISGKRKEGQDKLNVGCFYSFKYKS